MHAVVLYKNRFNQDSSPEEYILCHVRRVGKKKAEDEDTDQNDVGV
jgi:hypothetical protein